MGKYGGVAVLAALILSVLAAPLEGASAPERPRSATVVQVIDGDTFEIDSGERVRVRDFDTAELRRFDCEAERTLARAARDAATGLLLGHEVRLEVSGRDRYGRLVADVTRLEGGDDYVALMLAAGHGARWRYGREPQPDWCARAS